MKTIKVVKELKPENLCAVSDYAAAELASVPKHCEILAEGSVVIWELEVDSHFAGYAGIAQESLIGQQIFWCMFVETPTFAAIKAYRFFSALLGKHYPNCVTYVEQNWRPGERFAKFCGFHPTEEVFSVGDKSFSRYVRKN